MLKAILRDNTLENTISEKGYVLIPNFLSKDKVRYLFELYNRLHDRTTKQNGMWNSLYDISRQLSEDVSLTILDKINAELNNTFEDYAAPVATFMSKNPGEIGVCNLHRDFSILNEKKYEYRNLWIPLVDITLQNGALYAVSGSHKVFNYPLPMFCKWPYEHLQDFLYKQATMFSAKAGDLIIYTDRTLHGSLLNKSADSRPVIHLGVLPSSYELAYYFLGLDNIVKVFKVPYNFFFENNFVDLTGTAPILDKFLFQPPTFSLENIADLIPQKK